MFQVTCPACRLALQIPLAQHGVPLRCPGCKKTFTLRPAEPPRPVPRAERLRLGAATSRGMVRERNEDAYLAHHGSWVTRAGRFEVAVALVADGMGGHSAGDVASLEAVSAFARTVLPRIAEWPGLDRPPEDELVLDIVDLGLWEASRAITASADNCPDWNDMGATAVAVLLVQGRAAICHVGDCRAYRVSGGRLEQVTQDQTLAARLVAKGMLDARDLQGHPAASQVAQALGRVFDEGPSRRVVEMLAGDWLLLACDGLHAHLEPSEVEAVFRTATEAQSVANELVRLADEAGGSDNCTVIVVQTRGAS